MATTAQEALEAYDALYKNPRTGEYIIDGDEAQVAADLAAVVREQKIPGDIVKRHLEDFGARMSDNPTPESTSRAVYGTLMALVEEIDPNFREA